MSADGMILRQRDAGVPEKRIQTELLARIADAVFEMAYPDKDIVPKPEYQVIGYLYQHPITGAFMVLGSPSNPAWRGAPLEPVYKAVQP